MERKSGLMDLQTKGGQVLANTGSEKRQEALFAVGFMEWTWHYCFLRTYLLSLYVYGCFACMHVCAPNVCLVPLEARISAPPEVELEMGESPTGCWELSQSLLQKQQALFTSEPSSLAPNPEKFKPWENKYQSVSLWPQWLTVRLKVEKTQDTGFLGIMQAQCISHMTSNQYLLFGNCNPY